LFGLGSLLPHLLAKMMLALSNRQVGARWGGLWRRRTRKVTWSTAQLLQQPQRHKVQVAPIDAPKQVTCVPAKESEKNKTFNCSHMRTKLFAAEQKTSGAGSFQGFEENKIELLTAFAWIVVACPSHPCGLSV
jgi:hypothetical protein